MFLSSRHDPSFSSLCQTSTGDKQPQISAVRAGSQRGFLHPTPLNSPSSLRCEGKKISLREGQTSPQEPPARVQAWLQVLRMEAPLSLLCLSFPLCKMRSVKLSSHRDALNIVTTFRIFLCQLSSKERENSVSGGGWRRPGAPGEDGELVTIDLYWCPVALGQSRDNPVVWSGVEPQAAFPSLVDVGALSHGSKP